MAIAEETAMLRKEQNDLLTRTGPGTPMGEMFRRYWIPALLAEELPEISAILCYHGGLVTDDPVGQLRGVAGAVRG